MRSWLLRSYLFLCQLQTLLPLPLLSKHLQSTVWIHPLHLGGEGSEQMNRVLLLIHGHEPHLVCPFPSGTPHMLLPHTVHTYEGVYTCTWPCPWDRSPSLSSSSQPWGNVPCDVPCLLPGLPCYEHVQTLLGHLHTQIELPCLQERARKRRREEKRQREGELSRRWFTPYPCPLLPPSPPE